MGLTEYNKSPGTNLNERAGSGLLAIVIHFNFSYDCCHIFLCCCRFGVFDRKRFIANRIVKL